MPKALSALLLLETAGSAYLISFPAKVSCNTKACRGSTVLSKGAFKVKWIKSLIRKSSMSGESTTKNSKFLDLWYWAIAEQLLVVSLLIKDRCMGSHMAVTIKEVASIWFLFFLRKSFLFCFEHISYSGKVNKRVFSALIFFLACLSKYSCRYIGYLICCL